MVPSHTSLLSVVLRDRTWLHVGTRPHTHAFSHMSTYSLSCPVKYRNTRPSTHITQLTHVVQSGSTVAKKAQLWVKSSITPRGEECLVDDKRIWKQNTYGFRRYHCTNQVGLNFLLFSVQAAFYMHSLTSLTLHNVYDNCHL